MKTFILFTLISFFSISLHAEVETALKITRLGAWSQGSTTFYITVDRTVGPTECRSKLLKIDLGKDSDNEVELKAKNAIRSMALAAFASDSYVEIHTLNSCLYNNPTFNQIWLHK